MQQDILIKACIIMFQEHQMVEYDSITKLHEDMCDALNILMHCYYEAWEQIKVRCGYDLASPETG